MPFGSVTGKDGCYLARLPGRGRATKPSVQSRTKGKTGLLTAEREELTRAGLLDPVAERRLRQAKIGRRGRDGLPSSRTSRTALVP